MSSAGGEPELRFLFDQHVSGVALRQLRDRGIDVLHAAEAGLATADDVELLLRARDLDRIVVTRNYRDFVPLAQAFARRGERFAGILFYPTSVRGNDPGAHVEALLSWIGRAREAGKNLAENTFDWLR